MLFEACFSKNKKDCDLYQCNLRQLCDRYKLLKNEKELKNENTINHSH